jgi:hypothetical protein
MQCRRYSRNGYDEKKIASKLWKMSFWLINLFITKYSERYFLTFFIFTNGKFTAVKKRHFMKDLSHRIFF